jgi:hypothetical protein
MAYGTPTYSRVAEVTRSVSKSFRLSSTGLVSIENKFGKVHVNTQNTTQTLSVLAEIKVGRNSTKDAEKILAQIEIEFEESAGGVRIITRLPDNMNSSKEDKLTVNYTINMPQTNPLQVKNAFGDVYIGDHTGGQVVQVSYGQLRAAHLKGTSNLKVGFGGLTAQSLETGKLQIEYSQATIEKAGNVEVKDDFSQVSIQVLETIRLQSKYGKIELGEVKVLEGNVSFAGHFSIKNLVGKATLTLKYVGSFEIESVGKSVESIELNSSFSDADIFLPQSLPFILDAEMSFGSVRYPTKRIERSDIEKTPSKQKLLLAYGINQPTFKVLLRGSYGKWVITQAE